MSKTKTIDEVLAKIQQDLKVPKSQKNSFGGYKYRSCEDIMEAVKKVLPEGYSIGASDEMIILGDRYYVKATVGLRGFGSSIAATGFAREAETKKGMDDSQITGTASSYARKYAANGLFAIDDTKDADTDSYAKQTKGSATKSKGGNQSLTAEQIEALMNACKTSTTLEKWRQKHTDALNDMPEYEDIKGRYIKLKKKLKGE